MNIYQEWKWNRVIIVVYIYVRFVVIVVFCYQSSQMYLTNKQIKLINRSRCIHFEIHTKILQDIYIYIYIYNVHAYMYTLIYNNLKE